MSNVIDDFIKQNEKVLEFLNLVGRDYANADHNFVVIKNFLVLINYNAALGVDLANLLQNLDIKNNYEGFELQDISRLFESLIRLQKYNLETYVEAAHFEWAVMENRDKAIEMAKSGILKASQKVDELNQLIVKIENDSPSIG